MVVVIVKLPWHHKVLSPDEHELGESERGGGLESRAGELGGVGYHGDNDGLEPGKKAGPAHFVLADLAYQVGFDIISSRTSEPQLVLDAGRVSRSFLQGDMDRKIRFRLPSMQELME